VQRRHSAAMTLGGLCARLHALDPAAVLQRGYAMAIAADGKVVTDAARLRVGEGLTLQFSRGSAAVQVHALLPAVRPEDDTR